MHFICPPDCRGVKTGKLCFELNSQPVGLQRVGKSIIVGCMDETLLCYSTKVNRAGLNSFILAACYSGLKTSIPRTR